MEVSSAAESASKALKELKGTLFCGKETNTQLLLSETAHQPKAGWTSPMPNRVTQGG